MTKENESGMENLDIDNIPNEAEDEEFKNWEELEKQKREFNVEGNKGTNQTFIMDSKGLTINNYNGMKMEPFLSKIPEDKRYDLRDEEECIDFVEKYINTEYFIVAFLLCIFERIIVSDLSELRLKLKGCILKSEIDNCVRADRENAIISLNSILASIGAKKSGEGEDEEYIGMGENYHYVLIRMLEQFPSIQDLFEMFLLEIVADGKYHTKFYIQQLASVMAKVKSAKVMDFQNRIYSRICEDAGNAYLLGYYIYELYLQNETTFENVCRQCMRTENTWEWRMVSVSYVVFSNSVNKFPFEKELEQLLIKKFMSYRGNDLRFMAGLLIQSREYRSLVCSVLFSVFAHVKSRDRQVALAGTYVYLVRLSYYLVDEDFMELPLVACDTKKQQEDIANILGKVMTEYRLRKRLYAVLRAYLKELSQYDFSEKLIKHIAGFCHNLSADDLDYKEDIKAFLKECNSKAAQKVYALL